MSKIPQERGGAGPFQTCDNGSALSSQAGTEAKPRSRRSQLPGLRPGARTQEREKPARRKTKAALPLALEVFI